MAEVETSELTDFLDHETIRIMGESIRGSGDIPGSKLRHHIAVVIQAQSAIERAGNDTEERRRVNQHYRRYGLNLDETADVLFTSMVTTAFTNLLWFGTEPQWDAALLSYQMEEVLRQILRSHEQSQQPQGVDDE